MNFSKYHIDTADFFILAGVVVIVCGVAHWSGAAALVVAGLFVIYIGACMEASKQKIDAERRNHDSAFRKTAGRA